MNVFLKNKGNGCVMHMLTYKMNGSLEGTTRKFHINCCREDPDAGWGAYSIISISSNQSTHLYALGLKSICEHVPNKKLFLIKSYMKQISVFLSLVFLEVGA